jgi:hypothetical protein
VLPTPPFVNSESARFLWKRIPPACKADKELAHLWNVGKLLWVRKYVEMFALLKSIAPGLSALNQSTVARFVKAHGQRTTSLMAQAYTTLSPGAAAGLTGMGAAELLGLLQAANWTEQDGMLVAPSAASGDGPPAGTAKTSTAGMQQLQQLTEYIVALE